MSQQSVFTHGAPIQGFQQLPVKPPEHFVGRDADLEAIHLSLKAGTAVLLHGPAGIGKSALAASLAAGYAELPNGVLWLDVAGDTTRSLVTRVARAYGLDVPGLDDDILETAKLVQATLRENRPLVVLDGHLRVEDAREFVRVCASGVPLLLTHPSMVAGPWTPHGVNALAREDSRALLLAHAGDALEADSADVRSLVRQFEGHPLSIEVAGRHIASGTAPADFLARIPDLPAGQKNLAIGVLMGIYRGLSSELQGMVMLLGTAFAAGASEELLCDVSGARPDVLRARMAQVIEHGLAARRLVYGQPYYTVHELVHEFAQAFLRGKKRLNTMLARYVQSLPVYVKRHVGEQAIEDYQHLAIEMPNMLTTGMYAVREDKLDLLRELIDMLEATRDEGFIAACHFAPELDWLQYLLDHPNAAEIGIMALVPPLEPEPEAEPEIETVVPEPSEALPEPPESAALEPGEAPEAEVGDALEAPEVEAELPGRAVPAAPEAELEPPELPESEAAAELPEAEAEAETALTVGDEAQAEAIEAAPGVLLPAGAESLGQLAQVAQQGDPDTTIGQYEQAVQGFQADGNVEDELAAIEALAQLSLHSGKYEDVLAYLDRGTSLAQEQDNPRREGEMLVILGDLQYDLDRLEGAELAYKEAVSALRPVEAWLDIGLTLEKLGTVYMRLRRPEDALGVWQQALPIFEQVERPDLLRRVLNRLGDVTMRQLQWQPAENYYARALQVAMELDEDRPQFVQLSKLAHLQERQGNPSLAIEFYRQALHLAFQLGDDALLGGTELALAKLLVDDTTQLNRALQLLEAAGQLLPEDTEVQRLLNRVRTRRDRLMKAEVDLPAAEDSLEDYAQVAFEKLQPEN